MIFPPPPLIEGYEFVQFLGRGAAGDVYLAKEIATGSEVALKLVRRNPNDREMFELEKQGARLQSELARVASQIPSVYLFNTLKSGEGEIFWVAMEYISGDDLATVLSRGPLREDRAIDIALQLLSFLARSHELAAEIDGRKVLGVIHGDLKPQNIRLQDKTRVRILDFGIARQLSVSNSYTHNSHGTLAYNAPERLKGGEVNAQSDLWSVTVILFLLLSGRLPFSGSTSAELHQQIVSGDRPSLPEGCSRQLQYLVYKGLNPVAAMRYSTASAMKADLEAIRDGRPLHLPEDSSEQESGADPISVVIPPPIYWRLSARLRWRLSVIALAVTAVFAISQAWVWQESQSILNALQGHSPQVKQLWERYKRASVVCTYTPLLGDSPQEMKQALRLAADRILTTYTAEIPKTTVDNWEQACFYLAAALTIDNDDAENRARLLYCKAQISLAGAFQARKSRQSAQKVAQLSIDALTGFEQASDLDQEWPDPYLAMAGIYAYTQSQFDLIRLKNCVDRAWKLGHPRDRRTKSLIADGHLRQSRNLLRKMREQRGTDGEFELAKDALYNATQAITLYVGMLDFGDCRKNWQEAKKLQAQAQRRIDGRLNVRRESEDG